MTREEFSVKYKMLKQIAGGNGQSYTAEHLPTGRAVLVDFLPHDSPGVAALPGAISLLTPSDRSKIIETLAVDDSAVVVTEFIDTGGAFERWLGIKTDAPAPRAASASDVIPSGSPAPAAALGEFTQIFRQEESSSQAPFDPPPDRPAVPPAPRGSFTELFRTPSDARPAPMPPPPSTPLAPRATPPAVPVKSLRVAPTPPAPAPAIPGAPPPPPLRPQAADPPPLVVRSADVPPVPGIPQRGFILPTMNAPGPGTEAASPAPVRQGPSDYTRILAGVPAASESAVDAGPAGAIGTKAAAEAGSARAPGAGDSPPARSQSYLPLWIALNVVLIVATGMILYFALRR